MSRTSRDDWWQSEEQEEEHVVWYDPDERILGPVPETHDTTTITSWTRGNYRRHTGAHERVRGRPPEMIGGTVGNRKRNMCVYDHDDRSLGPVHENHDHDPFLVPDYSAGNY